MQRLLYSHRCAATTGCHRCQGSGQPAQDGAKTPGSKRTGYGQTHLPGAPEGMRNPAPGKSSYPSSPGYNSTWNNSNPRGSKPHCGKHHNPQTHTHTEQTTARALCPHITQDERFPRERTRSAILLCHHTGLQVRILKADVKLMPVQSCKHMKEGTPRETALGQALLPPCQPWDREGVLGLD